MKIFFLVLLYLLAAIQIALIYNLRKIHSRLGRYMTAVVSSGLITCLFYSVICFPIHSFIAAVFYGLYYASVTSLLMHVSTFVIEFTGIKIHSSIRILQYVAGTIDAVCILFLSITGRLFTLSMDTLGASSMWTTQMIHWYFSVHLGICYVYALVVLCLFAIKICITSRHQRDKFIHFILGLSVILFFNALYLVTDWPFDVSLFGYSIVSVIVYFLSFRYVPKDLVNVALSNAVADMQGIIVCFDMDDNCVYCNDVGRRYLAEFHGVHNGVRAFCKDYYTRWTQEHPAFFRTENEVITRTLTIPSAAGELRFDVRAKRAFDEKGLYLGSYFNIIDKTEEYREAAEREMRNRLDPLSGYLNREYFFSQVRDIILKNPDKEYYLTCSNIVDFKLFNSIYGEEQGNQLLIKCSEAIKAADTKMELYGRISGDLFGFLLEKDNFEENTFLQFISNLQDEFSNTFYKLRIQYGIYSITNRNEPVSSMCEKVTLTMKNHKTEHDKVIFFYNEDELGTKLLEKNLIGRFDRAIENNEILMYLQPQVDYDGTLVGAEALAGWVEPDGTIISPETFVPILERNGLISKVDLIIWNLAAQQLSSWAFLGREDLTISVNISIKDFYYIDLYQEFTSIVENYQISPANLCLEITESTIIQDVELVNETLQRLREYGFTVEIDDFGSGYSSLGMLKDISVDVLKLDMSFLRMTEKTREVRAWLIIEEIVRLADGLNMKKIIEGVEKKEQVDRLHALGCNCFQGFFYSQPEPVEIFERRLEG